MTVVLPAASSEELIAALRDPKLKALSNAFFGVGDVSKTELIVMSVNHTTIRAYRNNRIYGPLSLFRTWARRELHDHWIDRVERASADTQVFQEFHDTLSNRLQDFWLDAEHPDGLAPGSQSSVPSYGRARKLVDLFMKHTVLMEDMGEETRTRLRALINVPLDKYTLKHLSGVSETIGIRLPATKWTMGAVDAKNYLPLQKLIRDVTTKAGVDPIVFDVLAWNVEHPNITNDFLKKWGPGSPRSRDQVADILFEPIPKQAWKEKVDAFFRDRRERDRANRKTSNPKQKTM